MKAGVIRITNQSQFDGLQNEIISLANSGDKSIQVIFSQGQYFFREGHIVLDGLDCPELSIDIVGNGASVVASGNDYCDGDFYQGSFDFNNSLLSGDFMEPVTAWSDMLKAESQAEVVDRNSKLCRIKYSSAVPMSCEECSGTYVLVTSWFNSFVCKVEKVEDGYIYFTAPELAVNATYNKYNINLDFAYGRTFPRFKMCNAKGIDSEFNIESGKVRLSGNVKMVHECTAMRFLFVKDCSFHSFRMSGLDIHGNACRKFFLIDFARVKSSAVEISNCRFSDISSTILRATMCRNLCFISNEVNRCCRSAVQSDNQCSDVRVVGNSFCNVGSLCNNDYAVTASGTNYRIAENRICDFCCGAIAVGVWHGASKDCKSAGVVESNEIWFSQKFFDDAWKHMVMDTGAIYVFSQNDACTIRYNRIHDYNGPKDNRGIFCDDGAFNVDIYGNVIRNISNSYCIDSRRVKFVEKKSGGALEKVNYNNRVYGNYIDGGIRLEGTENDDKCEKGINFFFVKEGTRIPQCSYCNISTFAEDVKVEYKYTKSGLLYLRRSDFRAAKQLPFFKQIIDFVKKAR